MARKRETRTYTIRGRFYADFRDFADVGGGQEALRPPGQARATTDPDVAAALATRRLEQLVAARRQRDLLQLPPDTALAAFAARHLVEKKRAGLVTDGWLGETERRLRAAVAFFGAGRPLAAIGVDDVHAWIAALRATSNGRRGRLSGGTIRHHLNALSNVYRRAQTERLVGPGYNPVAALLEKPAGRRHEARWLEPPAVAVLLEVARTLTRAKAYAAVPFTYELLATFALTGGRKAEVLGLEVADVSFDRQTVTFRPNAWRRLKTATSFRPVPLWPQLEAILRAYVFAQDRPPGRLLFPSRATGAETMLVEVRKLLDAVAVRAGWAAGEIRTRIFRHSYCAARLQTLDQGAPVSPFTVARELGHGGRALVDRVYGHLGTIRHRADVVGFAVGDHLGQELRDGETVAAFLRSLEGPPGAPGL
jgi:integrase